MITHDIVVRVEERAEGWWVVVDGGTSDLIEPEMRECGPAPSEAMARAHANDIAWILASALGVEILVGNPGRN